MLWWKQTAMSFHVGFLNKVSIAFAAWKWFCTCMQDHVSFNTFFFCKNSFANVAYSRHVCYIFLSPWNIVMWRFRCPRWPNSFEQTLQVRSKILHFCFNWLFVSWRLFVWYAIEWEIKFDYLRNICLRESIGHLKDPNKSSQPSHLKP